MYIRCPECQSASWIETLVPGEGAPFVACKTCEADLSLMSAGELGTTAEEQYKRALQYAEFNQIDLPSAYSVLLGLMPLDRAREKRQEQVANVERKPPAMAIVDRPGPTSIAGTGSPDEAPSIEHGSLASASAEEKRTLAARLARRHGFPMHLAQLVADGKLSLHSATRRQAEERSQAGGGSRADPVTRSQARIFGALAAVVLIAVVAFGVSRKQAYERRVSAADETLEAAARAAEEMARAPQPAAVAGPAAPRPSVEVRKDDEGQLVEIVGPNPQSVLLAFCQNSGNAERVEALELAEAIPPFPGKRIGVFRNFDELGALYAIEIHRDRESRRWIAGNGVDPIGMTIAPEQQEGSRRIPLSQ